MAFINTHRQSSATLDYIFEYRFYYSFAYEFKFFGIIAGVVILNLCLICIIVIYCCKKIKARRAQTFRPPKKSFNRDGDLLDSFTDKAVDKRVQDYAGKGSKHRMRHFSDAK